MIEITLLTDGEVGSVTVNVGVEPRTGFALKRRFRKYELNTQTKEHIVTYEEWLVAPDGKVYDRFYRWRQFKVVNIMDVVPNKLRYDSWLAAGRWKMYESAKLAWANGTIDFDSHSFKINLYSSASNANTLTAALVR